MEELIKQAFLHVEAIGPHVAKGHYDLIGPNGEIILPQVWETMVGPGCSVTMHMWPMPEGNPFTEHGQEEPRSRTAGGSDSRRPPWPKIRKSRNNIAAKDTSANLKDIGDKEKTPSDTEIPAGVETPGVNSIATTKRALQESQSPATELVPEESQAQGVGVKKDIKFQDYLGRNFSFPFVLAATWAVSKL